jgi:multiple sugar transport system permease protein
MPPRQVIMRLAMYAALIIWSFFCLLPPYWVLLASLKGEDAIIHGPRYLPFVDFTPSFEAWRFILLDSSESLIQPLLNSTIVSLCSTAIIIAATLFLLYAITRLPKTSTLLLPILLASRILPPVTLVLTLYLMAQKAGLLDTRTILILVYSAVNLPVAAWLLLPAFGTRATEQEEAARLDGLSHFGILLQILLPMQRNTCAAVALVIFILCWNEYLFAAWLTTNHATTLTPWMVGQLSMKEAQIGGEPEEWAHLSAATVLMVTPLLLFSTYAMRVLADRSTPK